MTKPLYPPRKHEFNYCRCGHIDAYHKLEFDTVIKDVYNCLIGKGFQSRYIECSICMCPKYQFQIRKGVNE